MGSVSTAPFCKRKTCPTTELLLLYQDALLAPALVQAVAAHLAECDFCGAELFLLTKYPPISLSYTPAPIPEPLHQLAKTMLGGAPAAASSALELICNNDHLTLTDA